MGQLFGRVIQHARLTMLRPIPPLPVAVVEATFGAAAMLLVGPAHPYRLLHDLVLQRGDPKRSCAPIPFRDVHAPHRLRVVVSAMNALFELLQPRVQLLAVADPLVDINTAVCKAMTLTPRPR